MNCAIPNCPGTLRVSHTYTVSSKKFQRALCERCGAIHALSTSAAVVTDRGEGAKALAAEATREQEQVG